MSRSDALYMVSSETPDHPTTRAIQACRRELAEALEAARARGIPQPIFLMVEVPRLGGFWIAGFRDLASMRALCPLFEELLDETSRARVQLPPPPGACRVVFCLASGNGDGVLALSELEAPGARTVSKGGSA